MKRLLVLLSCFLSFAALADQYQVTFGWTDTTTPPGPDYIPVYEAQYRVAGGAIVPVPNLETPAGSVSITANPGDQIELQGRAVNTYGGENIASAWTDWESAVALYNARTPGVQTGVFMTIQRTGP